MKKILLALGLVLVVLVAGGSSGLGTIWLAGAAVLAGGFGWMLGGLPSGPSGPEAHIGSGPDGTGGSGDSGGGGGEA
jgi:hypothetical protein